jgi:hypothetical protein
LISWTKDPFLFCRFPLPRRAAGLSNGIVLLANAAFLSMRARLYATNPLAGIFSSLQVVYPREASAYREKNAPFKLSSRASSHQSW